MMQKCVDNAIESSPACLPGKQAINFTEFSIPNGELFGKFL